MIVKDHWRITTAAIQLEMERLAGLLEKSAHFQSRTSTPHPLRERHGSQHPARPAASAAQPASQSAEIINRL